MFIIVACVAEDDKLPIAPNASDLQFPPLPLTMTLCDGRIGVVGVVLTRAYFVIHLDCCEEL